MGTKLSFVPTFDFDDAPDALAISVAGVMARQHADDSRAFLQSLAALLTSVMPGETVVERVGLWGGGKRSVRRLEVTFAEDSGATLTRYSLEDGGLGTIAAARAQIVRGIAVKNEPISPDDWIEAVSRAIVRRAEQHKATRDALQRLL